MFQALYLFCATVSGDDCRVIVSPLFNTEAACLADFQEGMTYALTEYPDKIFIEHRCIEWQHPFPNA